LIGISGVESDGTLRDYDYREVKVTRTIMAHAREIWLATDHTKFNRPAMVELGHLKDIDVLFTDEPPPPVFLELMTQADVECVVAASN
jgi:DeoR family glycerol-3-phosphate regulon repressor